MVFPQGIFQGVGGGKTGAGCVCGHGLHQWSQGQGAVQGCPHSAPQPLHSRKASGCSQGPTAEAGRHQPRHCTAHHWGGISTGQHATEQHTQHTMQALLDQPPCRTQCPCIVPNPAAQHSRTAPALNWVGDSIGPDTRFWGPGAFSAGPCLGCFEWGLDRGAKI